VGLKLNGTHQLLVYADDVNLNLETGIFGPRRDEVTGDWRKMHNEELH
jgi:hypothetical protein